MPINDELGTRMKENYEMRSRTSLLRRTPVILRIDGKAFHSFTKGFQKPFDEVLIEAMQKTMQYLCKNIQGCVFGYTQSDEITLVLVDYQTLTSCAWFDYEVQKLCSVGASMATMYFNKAFSEIVQPLLDEADPLTVAFHSSAYTDDYLNRIEAYHNAMKKGAMFDCRCFNVPEEEVVNCVYWRQIDAMRNSIQMIGQANFSHKELQNKTCRMIKEMLKTEKNIDWETYPKYLRWGTCCYRSGNEWKVDTDMPQLKDTGRKLLEVLIKTSDDIGAKN